MGIPSWASDVCIDEHERPYIASLSLCDMQTTHRPAHITSKFIALYSKLLQGVSPSRLDANGNSEQLYADLLDLEVDSSFLLGELQRISKDDCLGKHKVRLRSPVFNSD